jgi:hypothetical protein
MLLENPVRNLSKTFNYLKRKIIRFLVAEALSASSVKPVNHAGALPNRLGNDNLGNHSLGQVVHWEPVGNTSQSMFYGKPESSCDLFPTSHLVHNLESQCAVLLWRHAFCKSLNHAAQYHRHGHDRKTIKIEPKRNKNK